MRLAVRSIMLVAALLLPVAPAMAQTPGQGITTQTWPAGTELAEWNHGGRITTFHRGLLYLGGTDGQNTWVYDISNPQAPALRCTGPAGLNGHAWQKFGDLFYRQYWNPDRPNPTPAGESQFVSLADPCNRVEWTQPVHDFPVTSPVWGGGWMDNYPYLYGTNGIYDARIGWWPPLSTRNIFAESGINASNRFRIGNLLFLTPGDGQSGVAVFDIGDPVDPRLLDVMAGNVRQYTTAWQVWEHYLVLSIGDDSNGPDDDANTLVIDFSDPTDLRLAWTIPYDDLPGRYVHFQDDHAFSGRFNRGVKYDMRRREVVRRFDNGEHRFSDFQWIPLGHLLLVSGSEQNGSRSFLFTHQDGRDVSPPRVGYHLPRDGAINQPLTSAIGLVIHERLDATTVNDQTIQLRALGGEPLPAIVIHTSYDVINLVPVAPLAADTTYEVRLVDGGVRDVAGNSIEPYSFFFATGDTLQQAPRIDALTLAPASPVDTAQTVAFDAEVEFANAYRWSFGDGVETGWSASSAASHRFDRPGLFTVRLQARSASGDVASATRRLRVQAVNAAGASVASSSIVVDAAARRVLAVNPDHGSLAVFDADGRSRLAIHDACADPRSVAVDGAGRRWVACRGDDRLVALDAGGAIVRTLPTGRGSEPTALLFDAAGSTGYAALGSGDVLRFDPASAGETARITLGYPVHALALAGSTLYAARMQSADDAGTVARIDVASFTALAPVALPLDTTTADSGSAGRGLPNYIGALAVAPDQSRVWYAGKKDNLLRGLRPDRDQPALTFETSIRTLIGTLDADDASERVSERHDIDDSTLPLALAAPGGVPLFVALAGNDRVVALDPWQGVAVAEAAAGAAPRGLAVDPANGTLWVRNDLGRSVGVFDIAALLADGTPQIAPIITLPSVASEVLPAEVLAGKRLFYAAHDTRIGADGYLACASCHLDGGSDGRVWDFFQRGEGLRRTTTLAGRAGHGPLHWSANFDEMQDFEHDLREAFGGTGLMSDAQFFAGSRHHPLGDAKAGLSPELDALAAYVNSLDRVGRSPFRQADGSLGTAAAQGRTVFASLGCAGCHGGHAFTDSIAGRLHDVGTLGTLSGDRLGADLPGIDTPTLRGLWKESRFGHDGRFDDLAALLVDANDGRHGAVATLGSSDRAVLLAYLLAIDDDEPAAADPFVLEVLPGPAAQDPARPVALAIDTDLGDISRVDYLVNGSAVATRNAPGPFDATWNAAVAGADYRLQARITHATGAVTTTLEQTLQIHLRAGHVFGHGFEP
jgi:large repetitive protein